MKIRIEFFQDDFIDAIGAGIYKVTVSHHGRAALLYIGESVFVLVRCAAHLYELKRKPAYFGFDSNAIQDNGITLKFELLEKQNDMKIRKSREKRLIDDNSPLLQSGISDRMKPAEEKQEALTNFLNQP